MVVVVILSLVVSPLTLPAFITRLLGDDNRNISMTITKDSDDLDDYYWAPFFGAGASYDVRDNLYVALEYNCVGSSNDTNEGLTAPAASLYLAKVGYKFNA